MEANGGTEIRFLVDICCCSDIRRVCYHVRITHYREPFGQLYFLVQLMQFGIFKGKKLPMCCRDCLCGKGHFVASEVEAGCLCMCVLRVSGYTRADPGRSHTAVPGAGSGRCSRRSVTMAAITCAGLAFQTRECQPSLW